MGGVGPGVAGEAGAGGEGAEEVLVDGAELPAQVVEDGRMHQLKTTVRFL